MENEQNNKSGRYKFNFSSVLNVVLIVIVLLLSYQNYKLKSSGVFVDKPTILDKGETLQEVELLRENGEIRKFDFGNIKKDLIVCVFSTNCASCRENLNKWRSLTQSHSNRYEVLFVNADKTSDILQFKKDNNLTVDIYNVDEINMKLLKINAVPITYVISKKCDVLFSHLGKIREELNNI